MKTTTTIKVYAYPVKLKDHRTGALESDTIVIPADWLRICGSMGLEIGDDKHMIFRAYNRRGYEVLEIGHRRRLTLGVDLEKLYADHEKCKSNSQTFANLEVIAYA